MALIDELRQKTPALKNYSDAEIASALRQKPQFKDMPEAEFQAQVRGRSLPSTEKDEPGFGAGFSAGIDQLQAMGGGLVMAAGEKLDSEGMWNAGRDIYSDNMAEANENALGYGFTDLFSDPETSAWQWASYTAGNLLPMMATSLATGGIGGAVAGTGVKLLAGSVAKQAATRAGQAIGAYAGSAGMETGAIMGEVENADVALAHGSLAGALDALPIMRVLRKAGANELANKAASEISDSALKEVRRTAGRSAKGAAGRGALTQTLAEASTESLQGLIGQHASYWVDNNASLLNNLGDVDWKSMIDEGAAGGLMGGIMGAPSGVIERGRAKSQAERIEAAREQVAQEGGDALDQAMAGQQAEQSAQAESEAESNNVDPAELGNRIQMARDAASDLQNQAQGTEQGKARLRNLEMLVSRAEAQYDSGQIASAERVARQAERLAQRLTRDFNRSGSRENPAQGVWEQTPPFGGLLGRDGEQGHIGWDGEVIRAEGPTVDQTQYDPQARNVRRDEDLAAQRQGAERMREQQANARPQLADQGIQYGPGPVAGNANTGLDQPIQDPRFTDTGARQQAEDSRARQQRAADAAAEVARTRGQSETAYLPDNTPVGTRFRVMDLAELRPSNTADGKVNPDYPQELQPRDRTNANSQVQVRNIASRLNPERLGSSSDASSGAPIVGSDGVVESGNGRTMAIEQVYRANGQQAQAYRDFVRRQAADQGMDPSAVDDMQRPVLVRERTSNIDRADFARRANESQVAGMTAYEQAQADADTLTADDLQAWAPDQSGDPLAASNRGFQRRFVQQLGNNEAARYTTRDGQASPELGQRMQRAMFAKAYQDADMVEMATEQGDQMRNLTAGLQVAAPDLAMARETGNQDALDAIGTINDAVRLLRNARQGGMSVRELARQTDAFTDPVPETTALLAVSLNANLRSRPALSQAMRYIGQSVRQRAESARNGALFEDTTTNEDVFNAALQDQDKRAPERSPETDVQPGAERGERGPAEGRQAGAAQGDETGRQADALRGEPLDDEWTAFSEVSGTRGIPRAEMPQIKTEHRGAFANFLSARGIDSTEETVPALSLRPTQREFSEERVQAAKDREGGDRAILVSADGHVVDGHHQWMARADEGGDVRVIRLDAPIDQVLEAAREFPSSEVDNDAPLLDSYDEQELADREQTQREARQAETERRREEQRRAQVDAEADDFRLSGSDRVADVATADGQQDLSDAQPRDPETLSPRESEQQGAQPDRIDDFGERIEGARKDQVNRVVAGLETELTDTSTLSEAFPAPNYSKLVEEGVDPRAAAFVAVIRNSVPAKPRKAFKLKRWMQELKQAQSLARDLLSGDIDFERMLAKAQEGGSRYRAVEGALHTAELIAPLKPSLFAKAAKWKVEAGGGYSIFNGERISPNQTVYELRDERGRRTGLWATEFENMRESAANVIASAVQKDDTKPKSKQTPVNVYRDTRTNERFIAFKAGSRVIRLRGGFDSASAAADHITEHRDELQQQIDAMRAGPRMRNDSNAPREGVELREGDVTPDDFQNAFGFRGVQFGNYVEGKRRQADLNRAYDALMDLATTLGIPPRAMSLDGTLGLAFGARGKGGKRSAAAHYEPGQVVINLTKNSGPGSLAHEWFHALDNYIPHGQGSDTFQTDLTTDGPARAELAERWREMRQALKESGLEKRSREFDAPRSKPYYGTPIEMAARSFEKYVKDKLDERGIRNDYLVNISSDPEGPYPNAGEAPAVNAAFDRMMGTMEHRDTPRGIELYSLNPNREALKPAPRADDIYEMIHGHPELADARVIQSVKELPPEALVGMALRGINPADVRGMYIGGELYVIADNVESSQEGLEVAVHEAVGHKGMRGVLGEDLDRVMLDLYRSLPNSKEGRAALAEVRRDYPFLDPKKREDRVTIGEEMVAHMLEKGVRPKAWQKAVAKIRELLRRLFPMVGWTYTDVLALGEKARDHLARQQGARSPATAMRFSKASPTGSAAFKRWFGDSKVVDKSGNPKVVFHGSPDVRGIIDGGFTASPTRGEVYFFTDSDAVANTYADDSRAFDYQNAEPHTLPVYLSMQNPYIVDAKGAKWRETERHIQEARDGGHDGIIIRNSRDEYNNTDNGGRLSTVYAVFKPTQAKSAATENLRSRVDGIDLGDISNRGTFDGTNPDIRYSLAGKRKIPVADQFDDLTEAGRSMMGKFGESTPPKRFAEWYKSVADRAALKIRQGMVDKVAGLKELDEKLLGESMYEENITRSSWVLARMSNAANGALHAMLHTGRIALDPEQKILKLKDDDSKGLGAVLGQLGSSAEIQRFMMWIAANRSNRLNDEGREFLFDEAEIQAGMRFNEGTMTDGRSRRDAYDQAFKEFQQYRDDVLAVAEQAGIIKPEQREQWAEEFYVPFYRLSEEKGAPTGQMATAGLSRQQAYKRLKGGTQNINDLLQNTMMNFHHLLDASLKNQAASQAVENAKAMGMARRVPESSRDTSTSTFVMEGGQKAFYEIDDPIVFQSLTALAHPGMNSSLMKVMRGFKRVFTNLTTTTPQFMVANLIRDSLQASATSDVSKNAFANVALGAKTLKDARIKAQMMASGASFNFGHLYGNNPDELRGQLTRTMRDAKVIDGPYAVPDLLRAGWAKWNDFNNTAENLNRAAIYAENRAKGELRAAFESRDLIDFSSHGAWPAVRILIDIVPFLNARIQGLDKIYRSGVKPGTSVLAEAFGKGKANVTDKQAAARFWTVTGAVAMATVALYLHNQDDEEYQKLEDWQKDTYWFIRFGDQAFFIPKPFEVGAIATMAERMTEQFVDDEATGKVFVERMRHMMTDTFSFSPVPQMVQPALDVYANYDAFTQRPIESMGMERLSPELRRRTSTTQLASGISNLLNSTVGAIGNSDTNPLALSPIQVDHLISGYLGQVGSWAAASGDVAWNVATGRDDPDRKWYEYQPIRRFYQNLGDEDRYTKYGTVFYEGLREAQRAYSDVKELRELGRLEDAAAAANDQRAMLGLRKRLNRAQARLRTIKQQMDMIRRSNIDGELKRQRLDRLRAKQNLIQEALGKQILEVRAES